MWDELATDSEVQKGSKQFCVNTARVKGKLPNLIWGDQPFDFEKKEGKKSAEAIVVGGVTTIRGGQ